MYTLQEGIPQSDASAQAKTVEFPDFLAKGKRQKQQSEHKGRVSQRQQSFDSSIPLPLPKAKCFEAKRSPTILMSDGCTS